MCLLKGQSGQKENCIFVFTQIKKLKLPKLPEFKKGLRLNGTCYQSLGYPWSCSFTRLLSFFPLFICIILSSLPYLFIVKMNTVVDHGNLFFLLWLLRICRTGGDPAAALQTGIMDQVKKQVGAVFSGTVDDIPQKQKHFTWPTVNLLRWNGGKLGQRITQCMLGRRSLTNCHLNRYHWELGGVFIPLIK